MSHKVLIGLEFDGEYDPRVRAELEQLVAGLQTWQANVAPNDAQFLVAALDDQLTGERLVVPSDTVRPDFSVPGQAKFHAQGTSSGGVALMFGSAFADSGEPGPMGPPGPAGADGSSSGTAGGHVHGLQRVVGDGATTTFNLLDLAEYLEHIGVNGAFQDPNTFTLSADRSQITFAAAPTAGHVIALEYVVANL